jgi:hypothetical protein
MTTWIYRLPCTTIFLYRITDFPENTIGFVYQIEYEDGTKYIGKKNLYSVKTLPILKNGKIRPNAERIFTIGTGERIYHDRIKKESDWQTYNGSHKLCKNKIPKEKLILAYAYNKYQLTYLEAKYLFIYEVLEKEEFINDNILGSFYRSNRLNDNTIESN